jgi:methyl-accepting chemotaxis protein
VSVKTRLVVSIVTVLAVALGGLVAVIATLAAGQAQRDGLRNATAVAVEQARRVEADLGRQRGTAESLAQALAAQTEGRPGDRAYADALQVRLLAADPALLGVWTAFEPQAFDGSDRTFGGTTGTDASGRYIPYWYRDGDAIEVTALLDYETPGAGDYYLLPRDTGRSVAIEPYLYEVAGEQVLITSLSTPVTVGGRAIGVAGVDMPLATIQEQVGAIRPYDVGRAVLVSSQGVVVGSNRPGDEAGSPAAGPGADVVAAAVAGGETVQRTLDGDQGRVVYVAAPIEVGVDKHWALLVEIP